ncbi:tannase/feruloyl esterase family alpha/beta hydrolase [Falsiroseomonas ponticola]|uniref:tannase/feruloyl esterase family alpha/beta hydrolase n=1 Tax=Falsiroseomonas ponticola TaxID=2786951 RepID=UPI001932F8EA|nr:tannase/feruloyl esterase family alpha/beta hydrolase [Roseomonas ponticola]
MRRRTDTTPLPTRLAATPCAPLLAALLLAVPSLAAAQPRAAVPASFEGDCASLLATLSGLPGTTITAATTIPAGAVMAGGRQVDGRHVGGEAVAAHCRVLGTVNERTSPVDGRAYGIDFEMRLPLRWNGRFFHQGNGGLDGSVLPALAEFGGGPVTGGLHQGFAVLSSNAGNRDRGEANFGADPQARLDYGYQAVGSLTPVAREIIRRVYGKLPDRSYFGGCSNGGRHALVAATRYAAWYDGILAGAPAFTLPMSSVAQLWGAQRYLSVATDPANLGTAFTPAERRTVARAILNRCDALDGAADGIVQDTARCQAAFDLRRDVPSCTGARDGSCLTEAQKDVVASIYAGPALADGRRVYSSFPYDPGLSAANWALWEFTLPEARSTFSVGMIFKAPPESMTEFDRRGFATRPLETLASYPTSTTPLYPVAAMSFMNPVNPTDLSALRDRGGRILLYHGVSDAVFSVNTSINWFRDLDAAQGGRAAEFARVFPVPGMAHCSAGPATDQFDAITPLVRWVEEGIAPDRIVASARGPGTGGALNAELPADWAPNRTRPLCPYPQVARFVEGGNLEDAGSFACR